MLAPITPLRCLCGAPLPMSLDGDDDEGFYCSTRCARFDAMNALLGGEPGKEAPRTPKPRTISQMYPGGLALSFGGDDDHAADDTADDAADELRQGLTSLLSLGAHKSHYRMCQAKSSMLPAIELDESGDDGGDDCDSSASSTPSSRSPLAPPPAPSLKSSRDLALREELAALDAELTRTLLEVQTSPHWTYEDPLGFEGGMPSNLLGLDLGGEHRGEVEDRIAWAAVSSAEFASRGRSNSTPNLNSGGEFDFYAPKPDVAANPNGHFVGRIRSKLAALGRRPSAGV